MVTSLQLRPYQVAALDQIRALYGKGVKKVLLKLPTGAGKTLTFCTILKSAQEKGTYAIMVVHGKALVQQASDRLTREGVPHGVIQADHYLKRPEQLIQVCSISTLFRRKHLPKADLVVIDECHMAASPSYLWLAEAYRDAFFLPVSATPHVLKGLRHIADEVVAPIGIQELMDQGFLVPARYYVPSAPDLSRVKIDAKTKDYNSAELALVMDNAGICGDLVASYLKYGEGRPGIAFAVNIEHSKNIVAAYNAAGIAAAHIEAGTPGPERLRVLRELELGKLKIVSNVGILCVGVDLPHLGVIILARPTQSYNLHIQQIGRGTRPFKGKNDFIVLDHASNVMAHGLIEQDRECNLDGKTVEQKIITVRCDVCFHVWAPLDPKTGKRNYICQAITPAGKKCATNMTPDSPERGEREPLQEDRSRELIAISKKEDIEKMRRSKFIERTIKTAIAKNYKSGFIYHKLIEEYGDVLGKEVWQSIKERVAR